MPLIERARAYQATPPDLVRIAVESPLGTTWPPPGLVQVGEVIWGTSASGLPVPRYVELTGDVGALRDGQLWWSTLGEIMGRVEGLLARTVAKMLELYAGVETPEVGWLLALPFVFVAGRGNVMRWLSTTYRGSLSGSVEEFQFKIDFGNPGADPDLSEAGALTLAEQLAGLWATAWGAGPANWPTSVRFTEVGVVQKEQTAATDKDGKGGNLSQSYGTAWFMYPVGTVVQGASGQLALPFEVATAVTLDTDHRGPSGRGRLYLPPTHILSMGPGGLFIDDYVNACNGLIGLYLEAVKAATPYVPVVVSRRRLILNEIVATECGHVPDSQRRRRRSQVEGRLVRALA